MARFQIGVMLDSFKIDINRAIEEAARLGVQGVQAYAVDGEMKPSNLSEARKKDILDRIQSHGMVVAAICGDLGGHGFTREEENPCKIEESKRIVELAKQFACNVVTTHIGVVPKDSTCKRYEVLAQACRELGEFAQGMDAAFAVETGPETPETLCSFLKDVGTRGFCVNYDPANLVMVTGSDPVQGVYTLRDYIVHTHAKDGIMLKQSDPQVIYDFFAEGGIDDLNLKDYFLETPLGEGSVDFDAYLKALDEIGYHGFLTVEREVGDTPAKDLAHAVRFLKERQG
ncbi:sugar phosphate isomerase/epimerase family protein [Christensenella timonensis]|uniref:sugar phosphate isomerase/epimerase family protein n=1 Tax=Christensenella timonensis TaxID=1816678 RepID=UPI000836B941|nr:sugar phosphate isomerase/epimerase [Christensenella timonensis]